MSWAFMKSAVVDLDTIPNKFVWWKARAEGFTDNQSLNGQTLTDFSGQANHITWAQGTITFKHNIIGANPVVSFLGNTSYFQRNCILFNSSDFAFFIVGVPRDTRFRMVMWPSATCEIYNDSDLSLAMYVGNAAAAVGTPFVQNTPYLWTGRCTGGFITCYNNGVAGTPGAHSGNSGFNPTLLGGGQGIFTTSDVAEVMGIAPAPSLAVQAQVEAALRSIYGIT